jgi:hypothetical protein
LIPALDLLSFASWRPGRKALGEEVGREGRKKDQQTSVADLVLFWTGSGFYLLAKTGSGYV